MTPEDYTGRQEKRVWAIEQLIRIEGCLELVDVRDGFMYLTLRMALLHASEYLEKRDLEKKTT